MKHFLRIAAGVDVMPIMHALQRQPHLWDAQQFRTKFAGTPHGEVQDILLRFSDDSKMESKDDPDAIDAVMRDGACVWHPAAHYLPQVRPVVQDLMRAVGAYELDRLIITRLKPGGRILPHADNQGEYVHDPDRSRYHVVIQGLPGSIYRTGEEVVQMLTGEVWLFDALIEHEVQNNSADDRVHMLVDLRIWP